MQDTRTPFFLYLVENGLNIVLAFSLYPSLGVRGLALSVSLAYTAAAAVALADLRGRIGGVDGTRLLAHAGRVAVPTVAMGLVVAVVGAALAGQGRLVLLAHVVLAVALGAGAYLAGAGAMAVWAARRAPGQHGGDGHG